jgi:type II restriction enzyme
MKFDFAIGNPPYQNELKGDSNTATPIYNDFMDAAYEVANKTLLITPARFLFNAGYTPKKWNNKMLNDEHFKVISYIPNSTDAFHGVDIKGGVAITYHDIKKEFGAIKIFTRYPEVNGILHKVLKHKSFLSIESIIVTSFAYHFTKEVYEENPELVGRASKGHDYDIQSNTFSTYPELYSSEVHDKNEYIRILGRDGNNRSLKYIKRQYVTEVSNLYAYKAFFAKASGTGKFGEPLPEAIIGKPGDGATVTFMSIGAFGSIEETNNCIKYTKTKFSRTLLSVLKVTQDNTPPKWKYVPIQDFTDKSDIDWNCKISDIDLQLYKKYNLTQDEIDFIENNVKEME